MRRLWSGPVNSASARTCDGARRAVDALDDVLRDRGPRPEELARRAVERVDEPRLAGDAGHDAALFAAAQARIDPRHLARVGCDGRVDQHALERMIEVPVIDGVLVVPDRLARRGPKRERRVVIEVLLVVAGQHELRRRRRDRGADVDEVELGVVARDHPGADVPALVVGHVAPAVAAGLAGLRDRALAPELLARARVVARDDARVGAAVRLAVASRDQHAVRDERRGALLHVMDLVVEDLGFPDDARRVTASSA